MVKDLEGAPEGRQARAPAGSETSIWPRLTASNAVNYHFPQVTKACPSAELQTRDVGCHELLGEHIFAFSLPAFFLVALVLFELSFC